MRGTGSGVNGKETEAGPLAGRSPERGTSLCLSVASKAIPCEQGWSTQAFPKLRRGTGLRFCPQQKLQNPNRAATPASPTRPGASSQGAAAAPGPRGTQQCPFLQGLTARGAQRQVRPRGGGERRQKSGIIPRLQPRRREVEPLVQCHTARACQNWDPTPGPCIDLACTHQRPSREETEQ